ncbi:MAG: hypothetical protein H9Q67_05170 [Spiroplasma ixodetis]|nr:hypothetical protein [Spiroplasma ixodetis]
MKKIKEKLKNEFELYIVISFIKERKSPRESASQKERKRFSNVITLTIKELKIMEQIKILEIINRWGYLNTEQIALLLNKNNATVDTLIRILNNKKLIRVDQLTRKNIYMLSSLGNRKLGKKSKTIRTCLGSFLTYFWLN